MRVLDPSAGDGRFLAAAADYLEREAMRRGFDRERARAAIIDQCLVGMERDPEFADMARSRLGPGAQIHCCEALLETSADVRRVDVIVGNPPYVRSIHMARTDHELWEALQGRYAATSFGEWDVYAAFIEQSLEWLAPGGEAGLVVPSRWFTATFARKLREKLGQAGAVRALVEFGALQIFPNATTYAAVVFLSRSRSSHVDVARYTEQGWQCGSITSSSLTAQPWRLTLNERRTLLEELGSRAPCLGQVARIAKGAGTNADRVYVLDRAQVGSKYVRGFSKAAAEFVEVETRACRPCVRGRDVRPYGFVAGDVQCIVPYKYTGVLWPPEHLAEHPKLRAYLARFRDVLESREGGKYQGDLYYRFGRPQNMVFLGGDEPKIVVPDVARGGRALLDDSGAMVLDTAYAIRLLPEDQGYTLELLLAVLNSPMVRFWLMETGVPLRGGYVRLKTAYLESLPLPPLSARTERIQEMVRQGLAMDAVDMEAINDAVQHAYGVDATTWRELVMGEIPQEASPDGPGSGPGKVLPEGPPEVSGKLSPEVLPEVLSDAAPEASPEATIDHM